MEELKKYLSQNMMNMVKLKKREYKMLLKKIKVKINLFRNKKVLMPPFYTLLIKMIRTKRIKKL